LLDGVTSRSAGADHGLVLGIRCGKTTLARAILGILAANAQHEAGSIRFRDETFLKNAAPSRRRSDSRPAHHLHPAGPVRSFNPLFRIGSQAQEVMKWKSPRGPEKCGRGLFGFFRPLPAGAPQGR